MDIGGVTRGRQAKVSDASYTTYEAGVPLGAAVLDYCSVSGRP
jgi:hypothetical protein